MFDLNQRYNQRYDWHYDRSNVLPIHIKHVHSSISYQWLTYQKYDRRAHELPSGYGALASAVYS